MFEQTFVQAGAVMHRPWTMAASLTIQTGMVGILVLLPLIYTEQLPFRRLAEIISAPAPPAAPKPPAPLKAVELVKVDAAIRGQMLAPNRLMDPGRFIPKKAEIIIDKEPIGLAVPRIGEGDPTGVIGVDGRVRELRAVSGHALLIPAAIEAVSRWLYSPTLLNGDPVEVSTTIDVTFNLN